MKNKQNRHIAVLVVMFVLLVLFEYLAPHPIDWTMNFEQENKEPYGSFVVHKLLPELFSLPIETNEESLYETFYDTLTTNSNWIFITHNFKLDQLDLEKLLSLVAEGNNVFISSNSLSENIKDTLNIAIEMANFYELDDSVTQLNLEYPSIKTEVFRYFDLSLVQYFSQIDSCTTSILGTLDNEANFIKIRFGQGFFYLHSTPLVFSNFQILPQKQDKYPFFVLSHLPDQPTVWDNYYKPNSIKQYTPLRYILMNKPLKIAYYILLFAVILYFIFMSKRRQRAVPVITKPHNSSLEFIETIGQLYYHEGHNQKLAMKKYGFFIEHLRRKYYIQHAPVTNDEIRLAANKTNVSEQLIRQIVSAAGGINGQEQVSKTEMLQLTNMIEDFYSKTKV